MQRCSLSLNEALTSMSSSNALQSDEINSTDPIKTSLLSDLGLTPVQIIHQFILAVACLHRNQIGKSLDPLFLSSFLSSFFYSYLLIHNFQYLSTLRQFIMQN